MSGTLTFNVADVQHQLDLAKSGATKALYGTETGPGLWLVGDHGVYLMANSDAYDPKDGPAFAKECDPKLTEDYYDNKREIFGGDDGVEFLSMAMVAEALAAEALIGRKTVRLKLTPKTIAFSR